MKYRQRVSINQVAACNQVESENDVIDLMELHL